MDAYATDTMLAYNAHRAELRAEAGDYTFGDSVLQRQVRDHLEREGLERTPINIHLAVIAVLGDRNG